MGKPGDSNARRYTPLQAKTLKNVLAHRIETEFPRIGGPRIRNLCADLILEVIDAHVRPREHVQHGQILWMAISREDPPSQRRRIEDTDLTPVVLEVSTSEDIETRLQKKGRSELLLQKSLRLCRQAYEQGGVLSNSDLAELLTVSPADVSRLLAVYERQTSQVVPRRATVHDVGTGLTHKRIICFKHYAEGKAADEVARETYHSLEAVDRYLGQYDRVRHCRLQGLTPEETAYTLACRVALVCEYLAIDQALEDRDA